MSTPSQLSRRQALSSITLGAGAFSAACGPAALLPAAAAAGAAPATTASSALPASGTAQIVGNHQVLPLSFAPGKLRGISEQLIVSHHDNNYAGAVKNLNRVEQELARTTADTAPFMVAALRERELNFHNSKTLHEAYFANLGGDGHCGGSIELALAAAHGSAAAWETAFRATAGGLAGGSGWVLYWRLN
jgi:superoxide dismutase, Fe-Mn family